MRFVLVQHQQNPQIDPRKICDIVKLKPIILYTHKKQLQMNLKRIFGALLTVLGIAGLVYAAIRFVSNSSSNDLKTLLTFGALGLIFFVAGLSLIRTTKDEA